MTKQGPITEKITGLRQRRRADGSWRVWWEPNASARELGFEPVELDENRATWSARQAKQINEDVRRKRDGDIKIPTTAGGRTLSALIHLYKQDPEFTDRKPKTQASYTRNLNIIDKKWGSYPVASFTKPVMREWYMTNRTVRGETMAVRLTGMMSILFSFAELKGWRSEDSNPCFRLKMKIPKGRSRVATWDELDALLDAAIECGLPSIATAALLSVLQGQRETDILAATCGLFKQVTIPLGDSQKTVWTWKVDRSKRGTLGMMQMHPLALDRMLAHHDADHPDRALLIEERTGHAYGEDLFHRRWAEVRAAAAKHQPSLTGDNQLQFRDLRRTFAVWSKAGGASDDDVGDVLGNTAALDPQLQEVYMPPSFETATRAVLSIERPNAKKRKQA
jgi:integrase